MKTTIKQLSMIYLLLIVGCSEQAGLDLSKAKEEFETISNDLVSKMTGGGEEDAYNLLVHESVKKSTPLATFKKIGLKYSKSLGNLESLEISRVDVMYTTQGNVGNGVYVGTFENGKADVTINAIKGKSGWKITSFNINSPLFHENPEEYRRKIEIYVSESDLIKPGNLANVVSLKNNTTLIENVTILNTRWKMSLEAPKEGFVTVAVTKEQESILKNHSDISLRSPKSK